MFYKSRKAESWCIQDLSLGYYLPGASHRRQLTPRVPADGKKQSAASLSIENIKLLYKYLLLSRLIQPENAFICLFV